MSPSPCRYLRWREKYRAYGIGAIVDHTPVAQSNTTHVLRTVLPSWRIGFGFGPLLLGLELRLLSLEACDVCFETFALLAEPFFEEMDRRHELSSMGQNLLELEAGVDGVIIRISVCCHVTSPDGQ